MILTWGEASHIGAQPLVFVWPGAGAAAATKKQRGNIDFDQIRLIARQGTGGMFQMFAGSAANQGDALVFDPQGNAIDAGAPPALLVGKPAHHNSTGTAGQMAYDGSGNLYLCYAANSWMQIGSGGWSNSF
jgi:hypothetical protein